jgi:hypothetical protein
MYIICYFITIGFFLFGEGGGGGGGWLVNLNQKAIKIFVMKKSGNNYCNKVK